jgi:transcriptional regulator with XRE-family HTH domain
LSRALEREALALAGVDPIVAQLRAARLAREISQTEMAQAIGVQKHAQFSVLERGHRHPRLDSLRRWADALDFDLALVPKPVEVPGG